MTFKIVPVESRYQVVLDDEPSCVHGLTSGAGPEAIGGASSLVIAFSIWSTPDREEAYKAIDLVRDEKLSASIFLLPYDYPEELQTWHPSLSVKAGEIFIESSNRDDTRHVSIEPNAGSSPIWMLLHNGKTVETRQGILADEDIRSLLLEANSA